MSSRSSSDYNYYDMKTMNSEDNNHLQENPCLGCREDQPNQLAHIGKEGCLGDEYTDTDTDTDDEFPKYVECFKCECTIEVYMSVYERTPGTRGGNLIETYTGVKWRCTRCEWGEEKWNRIIKKKQKEAWPCKICNCCGVKEKGRGNSFTYNTNWVCSVCLQIHLPL